jgi:nucleoid-associated protein YgaU
MKKPTCTIPGQRRPTGPASMAAAASVVLLLSGNALAQDGEPRSDAMTATETGVQAVDVSELQSRIEALRQELATAREDLLQQAAQMAGLESENADLQSRLGEAQAQLASLRDEMAAKANQIATMNAESSTLRTQIEAARDELSAARETASQMASRAAEAEAAVQRQVDDLQNQLATANRELVSVQEEKAAVQSAAEQQMAALRALLPPDEGGSLDLDAARARAAQRAQTLRETHRELRSGNLDQEALQETFDQAVSDLRDEQILVNRIKKGTLYQVKEGDTLGIISARFYGSASAWPRVFDTNRHVLENADAVVPGTTLILP